MPSGLSLVAGLDMATLLPKPATYAGGPIADGMMVRAEFEPRLEAGAFHRVPLLIGTTSDDVPAMLPPDPGDPLAMFGDDRAKAIALYRPTPDRARVLRLLADLGRDLSMHEPARFVASRFTAAGAPSWLLRFSYVADSMRGRWPGAPHASEIPYAFATLEARLDLVRGRAPSRIR